MAIFKNQQGKYTKIQELINRTRQLKNSYEYILVKINRKW